MITPNSSAVLTSGEISDLKKYLIDEYQHNLPLSATPYADIAHRLGVEESDVIEALGSMKTDGTVSRVGFVFRPHRIGTSTLAAMAVPEDRIEAVAKLVNRYPQVNHNYEREHHFNLWFVLTAEDDYELNDVIDEIEYLSGLPVITLPMLDDYHIDLGFDLTRQAEAKVELVR